MLKNRKPISLVLLMLLATPMLIALCMVGYGKWLQYEMMEKLEENHLQVVSISLENIKWKTKDKEVIIGDAFFDIKYMIRKKNTIEFHGLFDHAEKKLEAQLEKSLSGNESSKGLFKVSQFMLQLQFLFSSKETNNWHKDSRISDYMQVGVKAYSNVTPDLDTPPPNSGFLIS